MQISKQQRQTLTAAAHNLKPVIIIGGKGFTPAVAAEIDRALNDHELIKIKINNPDREQRKAWSEDICSSLNAELVHAIGKIIVIYRKAEQD